MEENEKLLFILGAPKTASTSLCGLVNSHPDVFVMCEVDLNRKELSRWGKRLVGALPDMEQFCKLDYIDRLTPYRLAQQHLSAAGHAQKFFGDKFVGIDGEFNEYCQDVKTIFTVRYLPEWLMKDSVRAEYSFESDIVPVSVKYTKHFLQSFLFTKVIHVRMEDFLNHNHRVCDRIWNFLQLDPPRSGYAWWNTIGRYGREDPKSSLSWWKGHASSAISPRASDTRVELADHPFWDAILPIFDKYYFAKDNCSSFAPHEIQADVVALDSMLTTYSVPVELAYKSHYSESLNPRMKIRRSKKRALRKFVSFTDTSLAITRQKIGAVFSSALRKMFR